MDLFRKRLLCSRSAVKETRDEREEMALLEVLEVFDSLIEKVSSLESRHLISQDEIQSCKLDLRFLRMFFWSIFTLDHNHDGKIRRILVPVNRSLEAIGGISRNRLGSPSSFADAKLEAETWFLDVQSRIQRCKKECKVSCGPLLRCSLRCNSFENKTTTLDFLDALLENLKDLYMFNNGEILSTTTLHKMLRLLHILFDPTLEEWNGFKEMREFKVAVHAIAPYSAILVFSYWVTTKRDAHLRGYLFDVLQKYKRRVPVFKAFYIRILKEMKLRQLDSPLLGEIIQIYLDLLFDSLYGSAKSHLINFQHSVMFVISFLTNPPHQHAKDKEMMMITVEIEVLVIEYLYLHLLVDKREGNFSRVHDFKRKIELVKGKIQQVYDSIRDTFSYEIPKINGLGYFNFLIRNLGFLKEKLKRDTNFIPFAKYLIIEIEEELMSLRPYLGDLFERQKEQKELKDIWFKVIDLAYQTEHAINSCSVIGHPLWFYMARLMEVLREIKVVKSNLKKIEGRKAHDGGFLGCSTIAENKLPEVPWASSFNEVTVGLEKEVDIIVESLIRGSKFLDIVAIVGMAGLGKTTLANKVYDSSMVRRHFHMFAYCIVSQVHNAKRILLDILGDIKGKDDKMYDMIEEDLEDMLRKCLKGRRYLIIMDDMWDVKAWDEIKRSLPNDQNGSRIIFTTRIHNVALKAKKDCSVHHLRFLSDEESWELLQRKAFRAEGCPPNLLEVGKMIAKNCKGLPLTIVLIAGLLARTNRSLSSWNTISKAIRSYVSTEGCMDVLELSYQHLPEHLKPCFLYFGAFTKDTLISVNKLALLWIAEGFVQNANMENLKNVAKGYLCDLVDRSLVIANKRSSYGGIKSCRVHDLVHEFCQGKAQEENFFRIMDGNDASNSSSSTVCNAYRVCTTNMNMKCLGDATKICSSIRSLLYSHKWGINHHDRHDISNLKLVQVMDLEGLKGDTDSFTSSMGEISSLIHLRYIATSFPLERPTKVPSSISNLWNLEILILTGSKRFTLELPETIWNMTMLRHVNVGKCYLSNSGVKKSEAYLPMVKLESFSSPNISSTEALEDLLQRSPSLRKLSFHSNHAKDESQKDFHFPKVASLCKLESLKISCVVSELRLRPFSFPSTLKKLSLSGGFLPWMYLQTISEMPCLEVLKLQRGAFIGVEWDMEDTIFPMLKFLRLEFLDLHDWIAYDESFPSLEVLVVSECYHLNTIPPCFGKMLTLKRIEVFASPNATTSVVEIQEAQNNYGNEELEVIVSDWFTKKLNS